MAELSTPPTTAEELRAAILERYESLSKRLQQIASYVLDEPNAVALETLAVLSERIGVQPSAIVRFAKSFGFDGATQMQRLFRDGLLLGAHSLGYSERVREFAAAFLDRGMRHTRFGDADLDAEPRLNPLTRDAYRWLTRLARDEVAADTPELWKDWTRIERELEDMGPLLRHIDALEARVRRTQGPLWQRLCQRFRA